MSDPAGNHPSGLPSDSDADLVARFTRDARPVGTCASVQAFAEYLEGRLPAAGMDAFEAHLAGCAACRCMLIDLRAAAVCAPVLSWPRSRRMASQVALAAGLLLCTGLGFVLGGLTEAGRGQVRQAAAQALALGCAGLAEPIP